LAWSTEERNCRRHDIAGSDQRAQFERDRDRLLYSSAFHRLAGVTQVVRAGEAEYFHTRQQHTLKVAQVGRRLAQRCVASETYLAGTWGVDPEVVEAACLAHDLGHPPFGHIGEYTLNDLVEKAGDPDGFEGNAQSFRIITKIGVRFDEIAGFDLTRATMAAVLKYPWLRDRANPARSKKWSAYGSERVDFEWARQFHQDGRQTAEAALMDWADDIAYSVHDLEDFHRAAAIPWHLIFDPANANKFVTRIASKWFDRPSDAIERLHAALDNLTEYFGGYRALMLEPYDGSREHRVALRTLTSTLIGRYLQATRLNSDLSGEPVLRGAEEEAEVLVLKQITRDYIISSPTLLAQQHGQRRIIEGLFHAIVAGAEGKPKRHRLSWRLLDTFRRTSEDPCLPDFLPVRLHYLWDMSEGSLPRFAADCIAGLTETQAIALYGRLYGTAAGSVLDPIVR
jgi:dGTPase